MIINRIKKKKKRNTIDLRTNFTIELISSRLIRRDANLINPTTVRSKRNI